MIQGFIFVILYSFLIDSSCLSDMCCSDCTDVHWIYIFFSNKFRNIFYIVLLLFFRNDRCDNACKSTTVNTAYACANLLEEKLCQCKSSCDLLLVEIFHSVAVLKEFPGRFSGLVDQFKEFIIIIIVDRINSCSDSLFFPSFSRKALL